MSDEELNRILKEFDGRLDSLESSRFTPTALVLPADQQVVWVGDFMNRLEALEKMSKKAGEERLDNYELLIAQVKQIAELKESLNEVAQNRIGWEENIEKVLRDHINEHFKIADADRDDLNVIHSWKGNLILQLEKLDVGSARQTERCPKCGMVYGIFGLSGYCPQCNSKIEKKEDWYYEKTYSCDFKKPLGEKTEPEKEYKNYVANSPRFHLRKGKWGMYFWDNELDEDIPLQKVIDWLNILYSKNQSKELIEEIQTDLDDYEKTCVGNIGPYWQNRLNELQKKWQGRIK